MEYRGALVDGKQIVQVETDRYKEFLSNYSSLKIIERGAYLAQCISDGWVKE